MLKTFLEMFKDGFVSDVAKCFFRNQPMKSRKFYQQLEACIHQRAVQSLRSIEKRERASWMKRGMSLILLTSFNTHGRYLFPFSSIITLIDSNYIGGSHCDTSDARFQLGLGESKILTKGRTKFKHFQRKVGKNSDSQTRNHAHYKNTHISLC